MAAVSTEPECSLDDLVKGRLKSCRVTPKGMITGYLESKEAYDELVRDLKALGCRYSVRSCYAGKTDAGNLQYKILSPDLQIPFTGSPFHVEGTTYFLCTHGFRYFKSKATKEIEEKDESNNPPAKKKRRKTNESIKLGCPAKMTVKCIRVFPDYKTPADSWRRKCDLLKKLKADMKLTPPPRHELNFWIAVSSENAHTHKRATTQRIQPLHPDLITKIHNLVRDGKASVASVKSELSSFVEDMFKKSSIHPDPSNTAFYPSDKCIYNHIYDAKMAMSKLDLGLKVESVVSLCSTSLAGHSIDATAPCQEHHISEKCDSDAAVVPVLDTFSPDWHDQTVLPHNFVQVLNNNGTLMLMVTQPLGEQVVGRVESSITNPPASLVNVNLNDNIYTVISDPSEQPILPLNAGTSILMSQNCSDHDQMREVLAIQGNSHTIALDSDKNSGIDFEGVINMESSAILGIQNSPNIVEDRDDTSCHEDNSQFLFGGEDSQTELLKEAKSCSQKEFSELCSLPSVPLPKDHETSLFSSALGNEDSEKTLGGPCGFGPKKNCSKKTHKRKRLDLAMKNAGECVESTRKALRASAQDIINMSHWSSNSSLLEEMLRVFDKYRKHMRKELETKKGLLNSSELESSSPLSEKCRWRSRVKHSEFSENSLFQSTKQKDRQYFNSSKLPKQSGGTIFSSSESSVDYDDLVIMDQE